jgi:hypothetical protein
MLQVICICYDRLELRIAAKKAQQKGTASLMKF